MRKLLLATLVYTAAGLSSVSSWLSRAKSSASMQLGLLPFPLEDLMFPGEQRDVFLFEDRFIECLERDRVVGGLLLGDSGEVSDIGMLLQVDEIRTDSLSVWARLTCVGRCELSHVRRTESRYAIARATLYTDSDAKTAEVPEEDLRRIHAITAAQRRELLELLSSGVEELDDIPVAAGLIHVGADKADAPFGAYVTELDEELAFEHEEDDDYEDDLLAAECIFVGHSWDRPHQFGTCFYHCRDHGELDDEESGLDLDELLATRKEALWRAVTMRDAQEGAAPTESAAAAATTGAAAVAAGATAAPSVLAQLWDEQDEGRAARTLLSFAAAATLGPLERLEALLMTDASNRLQFALEKLSEQQETLASMLVLVKKEAARSGRF